MAVAAPGKRRLGACELGAGGSQGAVRNPQVRPRFVEGSIVRIFMENFL